jgi:inner membrane protein
MPTIISHAVAAYAAGKVILKSDERKILVAGIICSMIPDADVISFSFGIPYESMWGHRGITHSFFFAMILAGILTLLFRSAGKKNRSVAIFIFLFTATASHPVLDAFTNGGRGVAFFAPFNNERYFFPWRPIKVSPLGLDAFTRGYGFKVLLSEMKWIWLPSLLIIAVWRTIYIKK